MESRKIYARSEVLEEGEGEVVAASVKEFTSFSPLLDGPRVSYVANLYLSDGISGTGGVDLYPGSSNQQKAGRHGPDQGHRGRHRTARCDRWCLFP